MRDIVVEFGMNAGKVWDALNSWGSRTESQLMENTRLSAKEVHAAIGWLARENKIYEDGKLFKLGETNLAVKVGENAGKMWYMLHTQGESDILHISKLAQMDESDTYSALGWLAREGKINTKASERNDEVRSAKLEVEGMKGELESLHADLDARNHIIKEMTTQLTEGQTQFVENMGAVERLQMELAQNQTAMGKRNDEVR
ncbi:MAG: winged helix-turn-helix domain-containing protein, partial [Thermoplasmatales archaeon]|nr:winged helix-turn-helix domain-containing protein [Thermoplasmatales archaeon]